MKKKTLALLTATAMLFTAVASGCGTASSSGAAPAGASSQAAEAPANKDARVLKLSLTAPETSPTYTACVEFGKDLETRSNGSLKVEVYANTVLAGGNQVKAIEMTQKGTIEIGLVSGIVQAALIPDLNLTCVPWIWDSNEMVDKAIGIGSDAFKLYEQKFLEKDLVLLGFAENGFRELTNNKRPVKTIEDMKNLKIRVLGNNMLLDAFLALGANPTDVNFNELFTAMQQGAVDGQENPVSTIIVPQRYQECQKYMTVWKYSYDTQNLQMGKSTWESLTPEQQTAVREASAAFIDNQRKLAREGYDKDIQLLKDAGMEIYELSADELKPFKETVQKVVDENTAKYDQDIYKAIMACKTA